MARTAAAKAALAADALEAFLRDRPHAAVGQPQPAGPLPDQSFGETIAEDDRTRPSRQPSKVAPRPSDVAAEPWRLRHTDWLRHRLRVTGPAVALNSFRQAASGAGTIPWHLDLESLQEDWFHLLVNPASRSLSLAGARVLAGQLREAVERRHSFAVARVGRSRACPFDLHALVPVPADILDLGPDHPDALAWLWQHWGTAEALRHVAPDIAGDLSTGHEPVAGEAVFRLVFWSADWTPWRALGRIRTNWQSLRFDVQPDYATGG